MEKLQYAVVHKISGGEEFYAEARTKTAAVKRAKTTVDEFPDHVVFVTWFRSSDGQMGYINPNGDHAIIGISWG